MTLLETLKRKYGGTLAEVIAFGEHAAERMRKIEGRDAELERLAGEIKKARAAAETSGREPEQSAHDRGSKTRQDSLGKTSPISAFRQSEFEAKLVA